MSWRNASIDNGSELSISHTHSRIHRGTTFFAFEDISDLDIASPRIYGITTSLVLKPHIIFDVTASQGILAQLYSGSEFSGGTSIQGYNRNFASTKTPTMTIVHSPSGVTLGTLKAAGRVYASGTDQGQSTRAGGQLRNDDEFVLATDSKYILRVVAESDNTKAFVGIGWYEE